MPGLHFKYIKIVHVIGDLAAIAFSICAAFYFVNNGSGLIETTEIINFFICSVIAWFICASLLDTYKYYRIAKTIWVITNALKIIFLFFILTEASLNIFSIDYFSRSFLLHYYAILTSLVILWRIIVICFIKYFRRKGYNSRKVIIIGYGNGGQELRRFFNIHPEYGYRFVGFFDDNAIGKPEVVGSVNQVERFVLENEVNEIYCSPHDLEKEQIVRLLDFVDNNLVRLKFLPEPGNIQSNKLKIDFFDFLPIIILRNIPLDDVINKVIKRSFDIFFSLFVIIFILSWLLPILSIIIKLDSKGPAFFVQDRMGMDNKIFRCFKLRTMTVAHEDNNLKGTARNDRRITKIGAFLRKSSLDEFPQFFNVFLGHMSVVGPRPHMLQLNQEYAMIVDKYMVRHFIKPGITGLSQVRGYRGDTSEIYQIRGRVKLDLFYLENWTFMLDMKIIFYTMYNMLRGDNNAF